MGSIYGIPNTMYKRMKKIPCKQYSEGGYHTLNICGQTRYYPIQEIFHTLISGILIPQILRIVFILVS